MERKTWPGHIGYLGHLGALQETRHDSGMDVE
jgi:hypothetical protein